MSSCEVQKSATLAEIGALVGATLIGDGSVRIGGVEPLATATPGSLGFIRGSSYVPDFMKGRCSGALVHRGIDAEALRREDPLARPLLIVADADIALIKVLGFFAAQPFIEPGVHPTAIVHAGAKVHPSARIGAYCFIGPGATIAQDVVLLEHCSVGVDARIGERTMLHPGVRVLDRCTIGRDCILHSGVVIGTDGFGYHPSPDGRGLLKVPHIGIVEVHDHVEIGANSCVDRAKFGATVIGAGCKLDNLVQIGHGCRLGRCCILCGQAALAGSVTLGDGVVMGGKSGVTDNVSVGAGAKIGAGAGITNDVPPGAAYLGTPGEPASQWKRNAAAFRTLGEMMPQIKRYLRSLSNDL